jgi:hypothetical protein
MTRYTGSCHCGALRFEVEADIERVIECNCSICTKKGILHFRVPPERFRLLSGESQLGTYRFGTRAAKHHFCKTCGIHTFTRPRAAPELYTVNLRCLDGIDLAAFKERIVPFDGRNWEAAAGQLK